MPNNRLLLVPAEVLEVNIEMKQRWNKVILYLHL